MEIELQEIVRFIQPIPPFDLLPAEVVMSLPTKIAIHYLPKQQFIDSLHDGLLLIRAGAIAIYDAEKQLLAQLAEAEHIALDTLGDWQLITLEDSLIYHIPAAALQPLLQQHPQFAAYFQQQLHQQLQHALQQLRNNQTIDYALLNTPVSQLMQPVVKLCSSSATIQKLAQFMDQYHLTAALIGEQQQLQGIVTDLDLRSRCLAKALPASTPVAEIMTKHPITIMQDATAFDALIFMTQHQIHHLPVLQDDVAVGIITTAELAQLHNDTPLGMVHSLRTTINRQQLIDAASRLGEIERKLVHNDTPAYQVGAIMTTLSNTITRQAIELVRQEIKLPDIPFSWVSCGSDARREQLYDSDQDNALLIDNRATAVQIQQLQQFASEVNRLIAECGFRLCPGGVMAGTPECCLTVTQWQQQFQRWIDTPSAHNCAIAVNFIDMRTIYGDKSLLQQLQQHIIPLLQQSQSLHIGLIRHLLAQTIPIGFFRQLVLQTSADHHASLDIKAGAILPIVTIARLLAVQHGLIRATSTNRRLQLLQQKQLLSEEDSQSLQQAWNFASALRLRHKQNPLIAEHDNHIDPQHLSAWERQHLKAIFIELRRWQQLLAVQTTP